MKIVFRHKLLQTAVMAVCTLPMATAYAQQVDHDRAGEAPPAARMPEPRFDARASKLVGKAVRNSVGERLGRVEDLFVDTARQRVPYAVLSFGGFSESGDKLFVFPLRQTYLSPYGEEVVINVRRELLARAPGFARGNWPVTLEPGFFSGVAQFFAEPEVPGPALRLRRASDLLGRGIENRVGDKVGELEDFVVDMASGRIGYAVLALDRKFSIDEQLLPAPLSAFWYPTGPDEALVLMMPPDRLDTARAFAPDRWPDLNAPAFRKEVDAAILGPERGGGRPDQAQGEAPAAVSGASR